MFLCSSYWLHATDLVNILVCAVFSDVIDKSHNLTVYNFCVSFHSRFIQFIYNIFE